MSTLTRSIRSALIVLVILTVVGCAGSRTRESTGEYIDDSVITTKVKALLVADKDVKAGQVKVETFKGVVQLSGFVDNAAQSQKAAQITRTVRGVRQVKNNLIVK
ncbi:BON domain-containing protein [Candidatus Entotheonella palauensis]|uniref:BON domain-containing protein n=1 Tax=Candidatus Entotheonella palauensis TaxID=93172 RepID=UPI000B7D5BB4|nr:BON domain-containing protein [Candidatus Entotheonella palauensis]